jgi:predicted CXXCH cytochrome family protein
MKTVFAFYIFLTIAGAFCLPVLAQVKTTQKTCLDCHNKINTKRFIHKPSKESCNDCHVATGKPHPSEDVEGFKLTEKVPQLCFKCHENKYQFQNVHKPFSEGDCLSCHPVHSADEIHLTSILPPKQCYFCHTDLKDSVAKSSLVHGAMKNDISCLICHSPHASPEKKILLVEEKTLCFSCHNKPVITASRTIPNMKLLIEKNKYVHGAIDNNGCAVCHNPHASRNKNLLRASYPEGNYTAGKIENYNQCLSSCHENTLIEDAVSKETGFRTGSKNLHFLHVNKDKGRSCNNCHEVHASNNLYLLADNVKFGSWEMPLRFIRQEKGGSCTPGCHGEKSYAR